MESKRAAILALAILAAVAIAASAAYAATEGPTAGAAGSYSGTLYGYGVGPSTMGGYRGGMMGGYGGYPGMMGNANEANPMYQYMQQYMSGYWNSTYAP